MSQFHGALCKATIVALVTEKRSTVITKLMKALSTKIEALPMLSHSPAVSEFQKHGEKWSSYCNSYTVSTIQTHEVLGVIHSADSRAHLEGSRRTRPLTI